MRSTLVLILFICSSCAQIHRRNTEVTVLNPKFNYPIERMNSNDNWYHEFSCFDGPKTGRVYTTYKGDMNRALGFLYEMETVYDLTYRLVNGRFFLKDKTQVVSRPKNIKFEVAYCFYKSRRDRYSEYGEPDLLYMSVRLK